MPRGKKSSHSSGLPKPIPPEERHIPADNCCTRCMYNIPQGTFIIVFPGIGVLLTGVIIFSWTSEDDSWNSEVKRAGFILVILGGILTLMGVIYWCFLWCKNNPKQQKQQHKGPKRLRGRTKTQPVELVGVYRVRRESTGMPTALMMPANIATIS